MSAAYQTMSHKELDRSEATLSRSAVSSGSWMGTATSAAVVPALK